MKIRKLINEIGEGTILPYSYKRKVGRYKLNNNRDVVEVEFANNFGDSYTAILSRKNDYLFVSFSANGSYDVTTNRGDILRIMATIFSIFERVYVVTDKPFKGVAYKLSNDIDPVKKRQRNALYLKFIRTFAKIRYYTIEYTERRGGYVYINFLNQ